ncbi:MAG: hypothetical protein HOG03_17445 [Desulfobacula sp.]|jgi:hypothetical protein|uniref:hypothetical protein n=2 Tax=Desulfobacula sp. TaxID=2593537 RepID=UPI001D80D3B9|nr:hypothetical protein [Desulfobacula sp.]MBT3487273.1 hypothetical protein [Desulfobacula sp.]MBT3806363.1 hypothetical protein [Desulfobacula sp.]MBT4025920.1 hypothetical protein [Desulfobacula sp.]MBT4200919.1 hypothetical protein [Desulfobacula sp.]
MLSHLEKFYHFLLVIIFFTFLSFNLCFAGLNLNTQTLHSLDYTFVFNASYAPDATIGLVYKDSGKNDIMYKYVQAGSPSAGETITEFYSGYYGTPCIVYDSQSKPHVFTTQSQDIVHFYKNNDAWEKETVFTLDNTAYPTLSNQAIAVDVDGNDVFHVLSSGDYSIYYISNKGGTWSSAPSIVDEIPDTHVNIFGMKISIRGVPDMAIDKSSNAHVVYSTLYETRYLTNTSGTWAYEDIYKDQDIDYWPAENPAIALNTKGNPSIVGTEMGHAVTGSVTYAKLRFITRSGPNTWNQVVVAETDDNYSGSDGNIYTGVNAQLVFDAQDQPHILFSDLASSHNQNGWNYTKDGQIRYAVLNGGQWNISNLYPQSTNNGEMHKLWLHVSLTSSEVYIMGQEVIRTGNVYDLYNDTETYNLLYLAAPSQSSGTPAPDAPVFTMQAFGNDLAISWSDVPGATGYTLFYAPYPSGSPVESADLGAITSASYNLFSGAAYYIALKAYNSSGNSDYSNIEFFIMP